MSAHAPAKLEDLTFTLNFGVFKIDTKWKKDPRQESAAWALYVELSTRIATQDLDLDHGLVAEAHASLHELFGAVRDVLRKEGPVVGVGADTVGGIALRVLNHAVRPYLAKWHPALLDWEANRPSSVSTRAHERAWPDEAKCRGELRTLQTGLREYARILAKIAGAAE